MGQKVILCYGDSNTWGYIPSPNYGTPRRYTRTFRWTGILQELLGEFYYVVEEGLNGRTTNLNHSIEPDRNGKTYLSPCLYSHAPIDLIILALGGNDLNQCFNRSAEDIKIAIVDLINLISETKYGSDMLSSPKILLMSPPVPLESIEQQCALSDFESFSNTIDKAKQLQLLLEDLAKTRDLEFLNVNNVAMPSVLDGIHFNAGGHLKIAKALYEIVLDMFSIRRRY